MDEKDVHVPTTSTGHGKGARVNLKKKVPC